MALQTIILDDWDKGPRRIVVERAAGLDNHLTMRVDNAATFTLEVEELQKLVQQLGDAIEMF